MSHLGASCRGRGICNTERRDRQGHERVGRPCGESSPQAQLEDPMNTPDKPSIKELQRQTTRHGDSTQQSVLLRADVASALLEIAATALEHLRILDAPMSGHRYVAASRSALREALGKVRQ